MRRVPIIVNATVRVGAAAHSALLAASVPLAATGLTSRHFAPTCRTSSSFSSPAALSVNAMTNTTRLVVCNEQSRAFSSLAGSHSVLSRIRHMATKTTGITTAPTAAAGSAAGLAAASVVGRHFSTTGPSLVKAGGEQPPNNALQGVHNIKEWREEQKYEDDTGKQSDGGQGFEAGYLPFPPPFHTINIVMILFLANVLFYAVMNFIASDDMRDFLVEHFTLSHENWHRIYPFFTSSLYQENLFQLLIDCWLLWQFGNTVLGFLGPARMAAFWAMTCVGGGLFHVGRQYFELYYGIDPLEVRGRCYGPNPFILGLVGVEGLIFRHLNFMQNPPVPFLVMTAFVMIIDIWRIFTIKPEEHGAPTGGALVAYVFWALPTKFFGLSRLTAAI